MKRFLTFIIFISTFSTFAQLPCPNPTSNVVAKVLRVDFYEYGPNVCLIKDTMNNYYYINDCRFIEGELIKGEVRYHWTHRNSNEKQVCDFSSFTPYI